MAERRQTQTGDTHAPIPKESSTSPISNALYKYGAAVNVPTAVYAMQYANPEMYAACVREQAAEHRKTRLTGWEQDYDAVSFQYRAHQPDWS